MHENKFHIVADENAVGMAALGRRFGVIDRLPAEAITADSLKDADALIVRSVTKVDRALLDGASVRFVGSATAGIDHVDVEYLRHAGIAFHHAPASNAVSVVEYVLAALVVLCSRSRRRLDDLVVGVVGCGNVGSRLVERLTSLGATVLKNDPPRARNEDGFVDLETLLHQCNVVTLHTPLERLGAFPTHHLIDERAFDLMQPGAWLINAARGPIVDTEALNRALDAGRVGHAVIDTWEGEPGISLDLLRRATIATPHIAGYSYDSKLLGTRMVVEAMAHHFAMPFDATDIDATDIDDDDGRPGDKPEPSHPYILSPNREGTVGTFDVLPPDPALDAVEAARYVVGQSYDILADDARMRTAMSANQHSEASRAAAFRELRRLYPRRHSFERYRLHASHLRADVAQVLAGLGMKVEEEDVQVR